MRIILSIISFCVMILNLLLGYYYFGNFQQPRVSQEQQNQPIKVTLQILHNLPIISDLKFESEHYFRSQKQNFSMTQLINKLNLSNYYFNLLKLDLAFEIKSDLLIVLEPRPTAIKFFNRYNLTIVPLLAIGLKLADAEKIIVIFQNHNLTREQVIASLKTILLTTKQKYLKIINQFVVY